MPKPEFKADQVGSLLRPTELLQARQAYKADMIGLEQLRSLEDEAIIDVLAMQKQVGIEVFSDGEMRRDAWMSALADAVEGFIDDHNILRWHNPDGSIVDEPSRSKIAASKLLQTQRLTGHESSFLKRHSPGPFKITMPSPVSISRSGYKDGVTSEAYATRELFLAELVEIVRNEMLALISDGVSYIQLDEGFTDYISADWLDQLRRNGEDPDMSLAADIAAENACYDSVSKEDVTLAIHICRGNSRSRWGRSGGYDWLAEQVFSSLNVDRFLLEYDSDRAGAFDPLRFVPSGKTVVLGLITTKHGQLEKQDDILHRIDEATKYLPINQLALSPQCGFASVAEGNLLSDEDQRRKLELVVDTVRKVWG